VVPDSNEKNLIKESKRLVSPDLLRELSLFDDNEGVWLIFPFGLVASEGAK
jgi:hypothetical protein